MKNEPDKNKKYEWKRKDWIIKNIYIKKERKPFSVGGGGEDREWVKEAETRRNSRVTQAEKVG